jgi:hypothetical protein
MIRITCINKDGGHHDDPHEAITTLGWINEQNGQTGRSSKNEMITWLERGGKAFTRDAFNRTAALVVCTSRFGNKYVKTVADGFLSDNLLKLSECPLYA